MIEGKLINLRAIEMSDVDRYVVWLNDGEVTRYLQMRYPLSRLAEDDWVRKTASSPMAYGADMSFAIETKEGRHIGSVGFHHASPEDRAATLGIVIGDKEFWSRGYGTDTMLTLLRFGFETMNLNRIGLTVDARNQRAQACYGKCGFVEEARMRQARYAEGAYNDVLWMGILRDEWGALGAGGAAP